MKDLQGFHEKTLILFTFSRSQAGGEERKGKMGSMASLLYDGRTRKEGLSWIAMKNAPIVLMAWLRCIFALSGNRLSAVNVLCARPFIPTVIDLTRLELDGNPFSQGIYNRR